MQDEGAWAHTHNQPTAKTPMSHKLRWAGLIIAATLGIGLISWGIWGITHRQPWPDPRLAAAAHEATYPIYYPATLPKGFSRVATPPKVSANVFIYTLIYDGNKKLFVSAVPKPAGVQFSDFYNRILSNKTSVLNSAGTAVIGNANNQPIGSLVTSKTWVTMNAPHGIDSQRLQVLVSSLRALND